MNNKILSIVLTFFGVFLSMTAMIVIAPSVAYELRDSAKLMLKGTGYNETWQAGEPPQWLLNWCEYCSKDTSSPTFPNGHAEELRAKIEKVADIIVHFSKTQKQIEKTVKQELEGILEDAERLKISREEIRRMLRVAFNTRTYVKHYKNSDLR